MKKQTLTTLLALTLIWSVGVFIVLQNQPQRKVVENQSQLVGEIEFRSGPYYLRRLDSPYPVAVNEDASLTDWQWLKTGGTGFVHIRTQNDRQLSVYPNTEMRVTANSVQLLKGTLLIKQNQTARWTLVNSNGDHEIFQVDGEAQFLWQVHSGKSHIHPITPMSVEGTNVTSDQHAEWKDGKFHISNAHWKRIDMLGFSQVISDSDRLSVFTKDSDLKWEFSADDCFCKDVVNELPSRSGIWMARIKDPKGQIVSVPEFTQLRWVPEEAASKTASKTIVTQTAPKEPEPPQENTELGEGPEFMAPQSVPYIASAFPPRYKNAVVVDIGIIDPPESARYEVETSASADFSDSRKSQFRKPRFRLSLTHKKSVHYLRIRFSKGEKKSHWSSVSQVELIPQYEVSNLWFNGRQVGFGQISGISSYQLQWSKDSYFREPETLQISSSPWTPPSSWKKGNHYVRIQAEPPRGNAIWSQPIKIRWRPKK